MWTINFNTVTNEYIVLPIQDVIHNNYMFLAHGDGSGLITLAHSDSESEATTIMEAMKSRMKIKRQEKYN